MLLIVLLSIFYSQASAETWSPTGTVALSSGDVNIFDGITLNCVLSGSVNLNGADASVGSLALNGFLCNIIRFNGLPYNLEGNADGTVTLEGVNVQTVYNHCAGNLTATFDQATGVLVLKKR